VRAHVREVIAGIAPHDSVERFERLGVTVLQAAARFTGSGEVEAGEARVRARRFVVATGSSAFLPPIPGLAEATRPHQRDHLRPGHVSRPPDRGRRRSRWHRARSGVPPPWSLSHCS
jgi:pyruvate/2-oxoglutarate dehydrogenase complex dihydrolipoamide dehydrogenase (E3) component